MEIIDYFTVENSQFWLDEIKKCDWSAARLLSKMLANNTFEKTLGYGTLYLLIDNAHLLSFGTLTQRDCIEDDDMYPWIGFIFTRPQYRGHRYSQKLINKMLSDATKQGYSCVYLASEHIGLYEKYGFTYLESRIDIWGDNNRIYFMDLPQFF